MENYVLFPSQVAVNSTDLWKEIEIWSSQEFKRLLIYPIWEVSGYICLMRALKSRVLQWSFLSTETVFNSTAESVLFNFFLTLFQWFNLSCWKLCVANWVAYTLEFRWNLASIFIACPVCCWQIWLAVDVNLMYERFNQFRSYYLHSSFWTKIYKFVREHFLLLREIFGRSVRLLGCSCTLWPLQLGLSRYRFLYNCFPSPTVDSSSSCLLPALCVLV